jgi:hypothetical protein
LVCVCCECVTHGRAGVVSCAAVCVLAASRGVLPSGPLAAMANFNYNYIFKYIIIGACVLRLHRPLVTHTHTRTHTLSLCVCVCVGVA